MACNDSYVENKYASATPTLGTSIVDNEEVSVGNVFNDSLSAGKSLLVASTNSSCVCAVQCTI